MIKLITVDEATGRRMYSRQEVAKICSCTIHTIRLWEEGGFIPTPERDENGYMYWDDEALERIKEYSALPRKEKYNKTLSLHRQGE